MPRRTNINRLGTVTKVPKVKTVGQMTSPSMSPGSQRRLSGEKTVGGSSKPGPNRDYTTKSTASVPKARGSVLAGAKTMARRAVPYVGVAVTGYEVGKAIGSSVKRKSGTGGQMRRKRSAPKPRVSAASAAQASFAENRAARKASAPKPSPRTNKSSSPKVTSRPKPKASAPTPKRKQATKQAAPVESRSMKSKSYKAAPKKKTAYETFEEYQRWGTSSARYQKGGKVKKPKEMTKGQMAANKLKNMKMTKRSKNQHHMYGKDKKWKGTGHIKAAYDKAIHFMNEGGPVMKKKSCGYMKGGGVKKRGMFDRLFYDMQKCNRTGEGCPPGHGSKKATAAPKMKTSSDPITTIRDASNRRNKRLKEIMSGMKHGGKVVAKNYMRGGKVKGDHYGSYKHSGAKHMHMDSNDSKITRS